LAPRSVAEVFEAPLRRIRHWIERGILPHLHVGRAVRILELDASVVFGSEPAGDETINAAFRGRDRLRLSEVAESLDVHPSRLKVLAAAGAFPAHVAPNGWWYVLRSELLSWLHENRIPSINEHDDTAATA
jgi:hypothetical protein